VRDLKAARFASLSLTDVRAAILFDLDGVLADSTRPIIDCLNAALVAVGLEPRPDDEITPIIGPPTEVGMGQLLGVAPEDPLVDRVVREYRARYAEGLHATPSYPGVPEAVRALAEGHLLGVATSKPRRYALPVLEAIGLAPLFAYVAGPEPGGPSDKRAMVAEAVAALPSATAMVGDRSYDVDAARAHGLRAVGVTWGFGTRDELAGADALVDDAGELLAALTS
jgi:phosphoglycolate phosphatase